MHTIEIYRTEDHTNVKKNRKIIILSKIEERTKVLSEIRG